MTKFQSLGHGNLSWKEAHDALSDVPGKGNSKEKTLELAMPKALKIKFWSDMEKQFIEEYAAESITPTRASICIEQAQIDLRLFDTDTSSINKKKVLETAFHFYFRDAPKKPNNLNIVDGKLNRTKFDIPKILKEANVSLDTWKLICAKFEGDYWSFYSQAKKVRDDYEKSKRKYLYSTETYTGDNAEFLSPKEVVNMIKDGVRVNYAANIATLKASNMLACVNSLLSPHGVYAELTFEARDEDLLDSNSVFSLSNGLEFCDATKVPILRAEAVTVGESRKIASLFW